MQMTPYLVYHTLSPNYSKLGLNLYVYLYSACHACASLSNLPRASVMAHGAVDRSMRDLRSYLRIHGWGPRYLESAVVEELPVERPLCGGHL